MDLNISATRLAVQESIACRLNETCDFFFNHERRVIALAENVGVDIAPRVISFRRGSPSPLERRARARECFFFIYIFLQSKLALCENIFTEVSSAANARACTRAFTRHRHCLAKLAHSHSRSLLPREMEHSVNSVSG